MSNQNRYHGEIVAGSLMVPESRKIAGLLLDEVSDAGWTMPLLKRMFSRKEVLLRPSGRQNSSESAFLLWSWK